MTWKKGVKEITKSLGVARLPGWGPRDPPDVTTLSGDAVENQSTSMSLEGSTRTGILTGCAIMDNGSRNAAVGFEPRTFRRLHLCEHSPKFLRRNFTARIDSCKRSTLWCLKLYFGGNSHRQKF
ncbi:hypothetical protein T265_10298 [Opisthorchis viverrini]|uniref:Uncharacterized protein n=1 Tax=Opisthorchis viverrini TaxID=6198 RepID=A0A074Z717_OPIVI|nr:hypothetical protein T265_10298 [Opisthorchis viverrini]KER21367.1 hypothetical protein T265_10298 [Opisthorchis viverrini]